MNVAVITPYYQESRALLRQGHESVLNQTYPCRHVLVADGVPQDELSTWEADHLLLPKSHHDIGSTPRLIGAYHAIGLGYDAVAFLDADNWYREDHVARLVELAVASAAGFASSSRMLCRLDGSEMATCPTTDPERFIDTSCMMFLRPAFFILSTWVLMPAYGHLIGDRIMLQRVRQSGIKTVHHPEPTVYYRCGKAGIYRSLGEPIPPGVQKPPDYQTAFRLWVEDGNPSLL